MVLKVISGGQTGADRAGLDAARDNGLPTGGSAPEQYWTTDGPCPELAAFGLVEIPISGADGYRKRTKHNVLDSTLTIAIASHMDSPGEKLTRSTCVKHNKPYFPFHIDTSLEVNEWLESEHFLKQFNEVVAFISQQSLLGWDVTLNVAGNSSRTSPRCYMFAYAACDKILKRVIENEQISSSV
jgi:hypothetical protein